MIRKLKMMGYLLWRYKIKLSLFPQTTTTNSTGSFSINYDKEIRESDGSFLNLCRINTKKVFIHWIKCDNITTTFLHEVGHIANIVRYVGKRRELRVLKDVLYSERRASTYALRVGKLFGVINPKQKAEVVNYWYGTYVAHFCKGDSAKLADESYRGVKTFGVRYD